MDDVDVAAVVDAVADVAVVAVGGDAYAAVPRDANVTADGVVVVVPVPVPVVGVGAAMVASSSDHHMWVRVFSEHLPE
eukprot:scaffold119195_cov50-Attheya_sp.AAC.3